MTGAATAAHPSGRRPRRLLRLAFLLAVATAAVACALPGAASAGVWCGGTAESATDRPDIASALSWHIIYAVPSDMPDRFADVVDPLIADLTAVDAWWKTQDATRAIRWDLALYPQCIGGLAALDISSIRLAHDSTWFNSVTGGIRWTRVHDDVVAAGFNDPEKKDLIFFDGPFAIPHRECGISRTSYPELGGGNSYSVVYIDASCNADLGTGAFTAVAAAHEMTHSMDALTKVAPGAPGPPHVCPGDSGHPCDSPTDLLYPSTAFGTPLSTKILDVGHDDYYAHPGPWWDVQDSPFLEHLDSTDTAAPGAPVGFTVRLARDGTVELVWQAATDDVGPLTYEFHRDGDFTVLTAALSYSERTSDGGIHTYTVRARDAVGHVGPSVSLRFAVGVGIVDANGAVIADVVPPGPVVNFHGRLAKNGFFLTWTPPIDPGGVAAYAVYRGGIRVAYTHAPAFSVPLSHSTGVWTVRAIDRAHRFGDVSPTVIVAKAGRIVAGRASPA